MAMSLNCLLLGKTSLSDSFTVNLYETNNVGDSKVLFNSLKIGDLKYIIYNEVRGGNLNEVKINCQELIAVNFLSNYFKNKDEADKSLIIVKLPTTAQETVETVMDAINIALKDAITSVDIVGPDDNMPFMERDTDEAIRMIIRNINNNLKYFDVPLSVIFLDVPPERESPLSLICLFKVIFITKHIYHYDGAVRRLMTVCIE
ncbi:20755_t:CDS:2, partial [Rhizophagus irregularis]